MPLILVMALDFWFTLAGQPKSYWQGMHSHCMEINPIAKMLLQTGPSYFVTAYIFYVFAICFLVSSLRKPMDTTIIIIVLLGHSWGSASWMPCLLRTSFGSELNDAGTWYLHIGYFGIIALACSICFRNQTNLSKEVKKTDVYEPSL